ncbi:MAG: glycoside-pentoside-hexuronide (GPH):cation symporter, partial [Defluviitaleaceae bacterium]|nr:glycoside-pentoside-hexuronide (GPH):cation symporter [Defluviitaleaceae bacterium]
MDTYKRNCYTFGMGIMGGEMVFAMVNMFLIFYFTDILIVDINTFIWIIIIMVGLRIFDAFTDPVISALIDNTKSRFGKFKPWIAVGSLLSGLFTILLFFDAGIQGEAFIMGFAILFFLWGIFHSANDIASWAMLPTLSLNSREREKMNTIARVCALIGLFMVFAGIVPITNMLGETAGGMVGAYSMAAVFVAGIMWFGQLITIFGIKEPRGVFLESEHISLKGMAKIISKNDQLFWIVIIMGLFAVGYTTMITLGIYFFIYVFGDARMFTVFAVIMGISQMVSLALFPILVRFLKRKAIYSIASILTVSGYAVFFFAPMDTITIIGIGTSLIFIGQGGIQFVMTLFLSDTIDYGHLKSGKRNDSAAKSIQPLISKAGGALSGGIAGITLILTGIFGGETEITADNEDFMIFKIVMLILPLLCVVVGFIIHSLKYKINEIYYQEIIDELL